MNKYTVWSKNNCSFCQQAKSLLLIKGLDFEVKMLDQDYSMEDFVKKFPTTRTFPAIEFNEEYIGGFQQLKESL